MSSYPGAIDDFTHRTDLVDDVMAIDVNELQDAIEAIETELGTDPAGSAADLKTRLAKSLSGSGLILLTTSGSKTVASGVLTIDSNYHEVAGEGSTDDTITSISGGVNNQLFLMRNGVSGTTLTIQHGTIRCTGGADITLEYEELCWLYYDGTTWYATKGGGSGGGGAPTDAQYVTLATHVDLSAERVLTAGGSIGITDGGANNAVTIRVLVDDVNLILHGQVYS